MSSKEITGVELLTSVELTETFCSGPTSPGPGRQGALAMPTICPWIAVPTTVPRTSTVIPDRKKTKRKKAQDTEDTW